MPIRLFVLAAALATLTACQAMSANPTWHGRPCHDRPFEAGICAQPSNFHLGEALADR